MSTPDIRTWNPGDPAPRTYSKYKSLAMDQLSVAERYRLLIGSVVPRPIAFISTINRTGQTNLAPFSFFNGVSSDPPCLSVSISRHADASLKDTARNIEETKEFVVNIVTADLAGPAVYCAGHFPCGVSELETVGLTPMNSHRVSPPRVKESPIHFECRLYTSVSIGDAHAGATTLFIGEILEMHLDQSIYNDGKPDYQALDPLARLGGIGYGRLGEVFQMKVPKV